MPIQFGTLITGIDAIISMATKMSQTFRQRSERASDLQQRVATLEANEADQYKLIQEMAETMRTLTDDVRIVTRRTTVAMVLSVTAALLAAAALVVVLVTRT